MSGALPPAVVFDCDGTLADTESLAERAWAWLLAEHGYEPTREDFRAVIGWPSPATFDYFREKADLGDPDVFRTRLRERFLALFDAGLEVYPDAVDTLRAVAEAGVPVGVASSSRRQHVERVLEQADLIDCVVAIVGADDVERHKPDPQPYVRAAALLGVVPTACAAVEDTAVGVASASAAGLFTVAVLRGHHTAQELAVADRVVDQVTVDALRPPAGRPTFMPAPGAAPGRRAGAPREAG